MKIDGVKVGEDGIIGSRVFFERIRRITGYLVGDVRSRFNNAKRAEEGDRVRHFSFLSWEDRNSGLGSDWLETRERSDGIGYPETWPWLKDVGNGGGNVGNGGGIGSQQTWPWLNCGGNGGGNADGNGGNGGGGSLAEARE